MLESRVGPAPHEAFQMLEMARLRDENEQMQAALEHYAKPLTLGAGEHSVFLDLGGVARATLERIKGLRP